MHCETNRWGFKDGFFCRKHVEHTSFHHITAATLYMTHQKVRHLRLSSVSTDSDDNWHMEICRSSSREDTFECCNRKIKTDWQINAMTESHSWRLRLVSCEFLSLVKHSSRAIMCGTWWDIPADCCRGVCMVLGWSGAERTESPMQDCGRTEN